VQHHPAVVEMKTNVELTSSTQQIVLSEIAHISCLIRGQNTRALAQSFEEMSKLRMILLSKRSLKENIHDPVMIVQPFLNLLCNPNVSMELSSASLSALQTLMKTELYSLISSDNAIRISDATIDGILACRFFSLEQQLLGDEAVLLQSFITLNDCIKSPVGDFVSQKHLESIVKGMIRINFDFRSSDLLKKSFEFNLLELVSSVVSRVESSEAEGISSVCHLLLFFCQQLDSSEVASLPDLRTLFLRLILVALQRSGAYLAANDGFVEVIQQVVCKSIIKNCASCLEDCAIMSYGVNCMQTLLVLIPHSIKAHIQTFVHFVVLRLLESKKPSPECHEVLIEFLVDLLNKPDFSLFLYVNFDCDSHCQDLFERLVKFLCRSSFTDSTNTFSKRCLDCLIAVLRDMESRNNRSEFGDFQLIEAEKIKKKRLQTACEHFNRDPKKGFQYLQHVGIFSSSLKAQEVAMFFRHTPGLDKVVVGNFLGEKVDFNLEVLNEYCKCFEFGRLTLDEAFRLFLSTFMLPGEAQKIDRVVEAFSQEHYNQTNACDNKQFNHPDAVYSLAFGVIMLNTDAHNSQVKNKMTLTQFCKNMKGMNGKEDFPKEMLTDIFNSIIEDEIVLKSDGAASASADDELPAVSHRELADSIVAGKYMNESISAYCSTLDRDMLALVWGPILASLSVVYDNDMHSDVLELCHYGFYSLASLSSRFKMTEALNTLVFNLSKMSRVMSVQEGLQTSVHANFALHPKQQRAFINMLDMAHLYGNMLTDGWLIVIDCALSLYAPSVIQLNLPPNPKDSELDMIFQKSPSIRGKRDKSIYTANSNSVLKTHSIWTKIFPEIPYVQQESISSTTDTKVQGLIDTARRVLNLCALESIFLDAQTFQESALFHVVSSLITFIQRRSLSSGGAILSNMWMLDEEIASVSVRLLVSVVSTNGHRLELIWPRVFEQFTGMLKDARQLTPALQEVSIGMNKSTDVIHVCLLIHYMSGFVSLASKFMGNSIVESDFPRGLSSLLKFCRIPKMHEHFANERMAEAMEALICKNAARLKVTKTWSHVLDLLLLLTKALLAKHSTTVIFRVVSFLVLESGEISRDNFVEALKIVCAFASDQQEIQLSLEALDLICALQNRVAQWTSDDNEGCLQLWMLLLQTFASFSEDSRGDVRDHSLVCLQRCLFRFDSPNQFADWSKIFSQVQHSTFTSFTPLFVCNLSSRCCFR
jgi:brefeldin A-resistance guanine nucleotide exchange factor 1